MSIPNLSFILLFVKSPAESSAFYRSLLDLDPVEESPTFVMFALPNGINLGLWSRQTAQPIVTSNPGASEICFSEKSEMHVREVYDKWLNLGFKMAQTPIAMDGMSLTFVAVDPDGHRIRVLSMEDASS